MDLLVSSSPHLRSRLSTSRLIGQVVLSLLPAVVAALIFFKYLALILILNCTVTAVVTEEVVLKIRRKPSRLKDGSALLTGLLLALILPPETAWYAATLGAIFAILVGKQLFGGLGENIFNPALIGRAFLMAAYPKMLTTFAAPSVALNPLAFSFDAVSSATPLVLKKFNAIFTPLGNLFIGNISGSIGETSALCLIAGGLYLLLRKFADWRIPLSLLFTVTLISLFFYLINPANGSVFFHLFSGGLLFGTFFMATDPVTTPVTKRGRYLFGAGCGILILVIRYFGGLPEGVMYSILFMNMVTPLINRYTQPRRFGT